MKCIAIGILWSACILYSTIAFAQQRAPDRMKFANSLLERAVAALRADQTDAIARINRGDESFKVEGLNLFCAEPDGRLIVHSVRARRGENIVTYRDRTGRLFGKELFETAQEGSIKELDYILTRRPKCGPPRKVNGRVIPTGCPGIRIWIPTKAVFTKVGNLVCGVEFQKDRSRSRSGGSR